MDTTRHADVIVIGGGPAGSMAALQIARRGHSVLVVERSRFPRFHIGESMLPYMNGLLEKLGLLEGVRHQGYTLKTGAEFTGPDGDFFRIDFSSQGPNRQPNTFQLERAHFDRYLLEQARSAGAEIVTGATVNDLIMDGDRMVGVRWAAADGGEHTAHARYVVDASGRQGRISQKFGLRRTIDRLRMVSVFRHYADFDERNHDGVAGDIQICSHDDGWLWAIPIWPDVLSVGAVMPRATFRTATSPDAIFDEHAGRMPRLQERLRGATPMSDVRVETDYCYFTDTVTGPGWILVGDSGCFVDPLYSGGVYLAMTTGYQGGIAIADALADPREEAAVRNAYSDFYKSGYDTYFRLDYSFYESSCNIRSYAETLPDDLSVNHLSRLLCGDFWSADNPLGALQRENRRWDTFTQPFTFTGVCPIYPSDAATLEPGPTMKDVLAARASAYSKSG